MKKNQPFTADSGKLQRYAFIAAFLDLQLDQQLRQGALTIFSLNRLTATPLADAVRWTGEATAQAEQQRYPPADEEDGKLPSAPGDTGPLLSCYPLPLPVPSFSMPAEDTRLSTFHHTAHLLRWLSLVCGQLLPFHAVIPLAQQIKRSAVIWYLKSNRSNGIQICISSFPQAIDFRHNKSQQQNYRRNREVHLPRFYDIVLHLRIIFRILKLHPDDGKDNEIGPCASGPTDYFIIKPKSWTKKV
ncbi:hypothetical protein SAMN04488128_101874 [Chitinophaga eiseniae]|uniref:Uncharacterized protein n=1 Tax=Chitinophaga eiseniae TaxID=634771 RepID=A0A1T4LZE6_9BACT|nr:hypothetical protein [Chitinophaga eiseniae]SJZ60110.1 hypothetical protein SAMN04488128_101874 [Chitinophaga eiseniae]